jgi:hypothetical protein
MIKVEGNFLNIYISSNLAIIKLDFNYLGNRFHWTLGKNNMDFLQELQLS